MRPMPPSNRPTLKRIRGSNLKAIRIDKQDWQKLSESAHAIAFNDFKPADFERIDFAIIVEDEKTFEPLGYCVCREHDAKSLYLQFGGAFRGARGTSLSFKAYVVGLEWCKARYPRIVTKIGNDNAVMLKFAAKAGFLIVGVNNYNGTILLEHQLEAA